MKPDCTHSGAPVHRHHRGMDSLWFTAWHRFANKEWHKRLVRRYWKFVPRDVVLLCSYHHAEIHYIYDKIIIEVEVENQKSLYMFSRRQAQELQSRLRKACTKWLLLDTPGKDPARYDRSKRRRRRRLRKRLRND